MTAREQVTGWHFDPRDTPDHRRILRSPHNRAARLIRKRFPAGTRVTVRGWKGEGERPVGTVDRHVPGTDAQGGDLMVVWDHNGVRGRLAPINAELAE